MALSRVIAGTMTKAMIRTGPQQPSHSRYPQRRPLPEGLIATFPARVEALAQLHLEVRGSLFASVEFLRIFMSSSSLLPWLTMHPPRLTSHLTA